MAISPSAQPTVPPSTTPTCHSGSFAESVDLNAFPPSPLCVAVGTMVTVTMGPGWPVPVSSSDQVLRQVSATQGPKGSTGVYKALAVGSDTLSGTWNPPCFGSPPRCMEITSVGWTQEVTVVQSA